ncbi:MAG: hypothetical protein HYR56_32415 [Acidobacteria bacterium]|nr:hypothetical protein [Acidobacteriota bacterium]MBI3424918.1 hypothetical protein [Acidobacteriota bacterium]
MGQPGGAARRLQPAISFDRSALPVHVATAAAAYAARGPLPDLPDNFETDLEPVMSGTPAPDVIDPPDASTSNMRARISAPPPSLPTEEPLLKLKEELDERRKNGSSQICPHCDSREVSRRHRKFWQRLVFGLTQIRPYRCDNCGHAFYGNRQPHKRRKPLTNSEAELLKNSCFNLTEGGQPDDGQKSGN